VQLSILEEIDDGDQVLVPLSTVALIPQKVREPRDS
jgi:hypothetical protein